MIRTAAADRSSGMDDEFEEEPSLPPGTCIGPYVTRTGCEPRGWGDPTCLADGDGRAVELRLLAFPRERAPDFERELTATIPRLQALSHPHVRVVHGAGIDGGYGWIAGEIVDGESLSEWSARRAWSDVLGVMLRVGDALAALHEAGLGRVEILPDEVIVTRDGGVRVDVALAHAEHAAWSNDGPGRAGSLRYLAPERWLARPWTAQADQFSFCIAFWTSLFAEHPFPHGCLMELYMSVVEGRRRPPPADTTAPPWLIHALERGLARDPGARWPSMRALLAELDRPRGWLAWLRRRYG
jgi:eukaryotic-like serine/threonine-protein kinase